MLASSFLLNRQQLAGSYSLLSDAIQIVLGICLLVLLPLVVLVLAYIARFEDPLRIILRNCGLLALTHLGKMIQMLVLYTVVIVGFGYYQFCSGVITCCSEKQYPFVKAYLDFVPLKMHHKD